MTLEVHARALRKFAASLAADSADVPTAAGYTTQWLSFTGSSNGIFVGTDHMNDEVRSHLAKLWTRLGHVLDASGRELGKTATYYETTDHSVAVTMDGKVHAVDIAPGDGYNSQHTNPVDTVPEQPDDYEPPDQDGGDGGDGGDYDPGLVGIVPAI
jgi:hypothetical protein